MNDRPVLFSILPVLILALVLRLGLALFTDPATQLYGGGDSLWYMINGYGFFATDVMGYVYDFPYAANALPTPPLFLIITGIAQGIAGLEGAVILLWVLQSVTGTLVCYFAYRIGWWITADWRTGWIAAAALAVSPAFMMESARILTESTYIFFIMAGLWLYVDVLLRDEQAPQWGMVALVGAVFGLATLTRAVALLFPIGLAGHLILVRWRISWRQAVLAGLLLLVCHGAVTLTWTARNGLLYDRFIIGSDQMTAALWRGATTEDGSPQENDALLGEQTPAEQAREIIASDVMGYLQRRLSEWRDAYLQPYGTEALGDESLKALVQVWATNGFQVNDLHAIITSEHFVTKLAIYIWHYTGLLGGLIGMGLTWRRWRFTLPLIGFMVYTSLLHLVLLALPRYLFPLYPIWWIFAPITLLAMWDFLTKKRGDRAKAMPSSVSGEY